MFVIIFTIHEYMGPPTKALEYWNHKHTKSLNHNKRRRLSEPPPPRRPLASFLRRLTFLQFGYNKAPIPFILTCFEISNKLKYQWLGTTTRQTEVLTNHPINTCSVSRLFAHRFDAHELFIVGKYGSLYPTSPCYV